MKKTVQLLSLLMVLCVLFTSCAQVIGGLFAASPDVTVTPNGNVSTVKPQGSNVAQTPSTDTTDASEKTDALSVSQGSQIKDQDGNLLVPFDVAYPEVFASGETEYNSDALLLKFSKSFGGAITKELQECGFSSLEKFLKTQNGDWYRAYLAEDVEIANAMQKARALDTVLMADYDYIYETEAIDYDNVVCTSEENDNPFLCADAVKENPYWKDMYHLDKNQLQKAWKYLEDNGISAGGSSSVVVAVIDTGVDYTHPDLKANMWVNRGEIPGNGIDDDGNGYIDDVYGVSTVGSTYNHTGNPMDDHGHGTHVAGIIGATNNKEGIVGIAYNVKIMAIKAGQATGVFNQSDIAEAILYAYEMGADVINMSFGGSACSIAVQDALATAYTTATLVASAGNDGMLNEGLFSLPNYPAALSYVIGVMSVDATGVESAFTNYDVYAFNSIEYEIYAPGEQIMSTLPDGRYGKLSGTSMAAPVVSAAAALLRSYFTDRDMYPSKFIAAQLCATSEDTAICYNPNLHGKHNLPMLLNIEDALKKLPKPDINAYDFYVFDFVEFEGIEYPENNGDGVADAGETLFIGVVMRNRWGMSRDTIVTIDALSSLGVNNPYVEIINGTVNFDSIGTYSTKSTLIYNESSIITGISNPFIIKLAQNTPNDYLIGINVYATYGNALDEKDTTTYTYGKPGYYQVNFWARNGVILPSQITEDMTLTKDNYYIIPNSTYIYEGVTVTVEPGTQIQFWSDDPNDPYADTYIAYLNVAGSFICQGTEDEPIQLFPSEMMSWYRVDIRDSGTVELSYTTVINPHIAADSIDHCTFKYNYASNPWYRYLSNGRVESGYYNCASISTTTAQNCLFYKCGDAGADLPLQLYGTFIGCSFVDSNCGFSVGNFLNCVFMGNAAKDEYGNTRPSSLSLYNTLATGVGEVVRDPQTGTTYIAVKYNSEYNSHGGAVTLNMVRQIAKAWGGDIACLETKEEWDFVTSNFKSYVDYIGYGEWRYYGIGIAHQTDNAWVNGEPIGDFVPQAAYSGSCTVTLFNKSSGAKANEIRFDYATTHFILEIPGSIYVDNIYLRENEVKIDKESTHQIFANTIPATFDISGLIYVSEDESIATVSATGLVTPVGEGKTRILVYSPDYLVCDVLNLSVVEKVEVNNVKFEDIVLELGNSSTIVPTYLPANTTQRAITYASSNTGIAMVNDAGVVTAVGTGKTTILATAQNGIIYEITVQVVSKIESISFQNQFYITYLGDTDEGWQPIISPANATDYTLNYSTSDQAVAYVDANGKLVRAGVGTATLRAEVVGTNLYADVQISVHESPLTSSKVVCMDIQESTVLAVTEDGSLWVWGAGYHGGECCGSGDYWHYANVRVPLKIADGVKYAVFGQFDNYGDAYLHEYVSYINLEGELCKAQISWSVSNTTASVCEFDVSLSGLKAIYRHERSFYALTEDGLVWGVGVNECGQLGVGTTTNILIPALCGLTDVESIVPYYSSVAMLKSNGDLYVFGTSSNKYTMPTKVDSNVLNIRGGSEACFYEKMDGSQYHLDSTYGTPSKGYNVEIRGQATIYSNDEYYIEVSFRNDKVYYFETEVVGVTNPVRVFYADGTCFVLDASGDLYGFGKNEHYQLADLSQANRLYEAKRIFFGISSQDTTLEVDSSNVTEGILIEENFVIDFNSALMTNVGYPAIVLTDSTGKYVYMEKTIRLNKLILTPLYSLVNGETYTLVIPADAFTTAWGNSNASYSITFIYNNKTPIELLEATLKNGSVLTAGTLNATWDYTVAVAGDFFGDISLSLGQTLVDGLQVTLRENVLTITAEGLAPGEYTLTIPAGALKDNIGGVNTELVYTLTVPEPEEVVYQPLEVVYSSIASKTENVALLPQWYVAMNKAFSLDHSLVTLVDAEGNAIALNTVANGNELIISVQTALAQNATYTLTVANGALTDEIGATVEELSVAFTTLNLSDRFFWTVDGFATELEDEVFKNAWNYKFYNNAVLNNFNITNVEKWLRVTASDGGVAHKIGLGNNWWGTTLEDMIERQIIDFDDYQSLMDIIYAPYLTEAPSNTFPFVVAAYLLNAEGERVNKVSNETVTFVIEFNRDMDTSIPLRVRFGSSEPYAEYEITGKFVNARRWEGVYTLKTTIENGRQFIRIENGAAADDAYLILCETPGRFGFEIDTTSAQALTMFGEATATGVKLTWVQDDFNTLAGYNVYRSDREDGYYTRLNDYVIPVDIKEFFDDTVEPGKRYYYNFTVVKTDLSESTPSGKISIMSMDTMAPNIYHSPVRTAYTGSNLLITATVTDNLSLDTVILYYRTVGSTEWKSTQMTANNSRYTGLILADHITLDGIEYYIEARDGNNTTIKGSASAPYSVTVKLAVDANALGDVDGDGVITNKDALMLLQAANDLLNLTEEQFLRADINGDGELSAAEALRILQYVSGKVTTIV